MVTYPKQPNAPEGLYTNAVRQEEMAYIALPNIAWWSLMVNGLDNLFPTCVDLCSKLFNMLCRLVRHADLCAAPKIKSI